MRTPTAGRSPSRATGKTLSVVNAVALDEYVRGVVSSEMPQDWPLEAIKAQAVAARSFALSHRAGRRVRRLRGHPRPGVRRDRGGDVGRRSGGRARRRSRCSSTAGRSRRRSSSPAPAGGRPRVTDVFAGAKPTPYLVSVPDPVRHRVAVPHVGSGGRRRRGREQEARHPGPPDLQPVPAVGPGEVGRRRSAETARRSCRPATSGGRSACARRGSASASCRSARPAGTVTAGASVTLTGRIEQVDGVTLEQRVAGSPDWQAGPTVDARSRTVRSRSR